MKLFTYGTLRQGEALQRWLGDAPRTPATVQGNLYDYGAFPVADVVTGWGRIVGEVVDVTDLPRTDVDALIGMEVRAGYEALYVNARTTDEEGQEHSERVLCFHHPDAEYATESARDDGADYPAWTLPRLPGDDWSRRWEIPTADRNTIGELI